MTPPKTSTAGLIYAGAIHVVALAAVATLLGTGHIDGTVGAGLLGGLIGTGVGSGLTLLPSPLPAAQVVQVHTVAPPAVPPATSVVVTGPAGVGAAGTPASAAPPG